MTGLSYSIPIRWFITKKKTNIKYSLVFILCLYQKNFFCPLFCNMHVKEQKFCFSALQMEKGKLWFLHWQSFWIQKRRQFNLRARNIDEFLSMKLDWWTILSATFKTEKSEDLLRLWNDSKIQPSPLKT